MHKVYYKNRRLNMQITIDDDKIKAAAVVLHKNDDGGDERPSLAVYETAVAKWIENAANAMLAHPDYYAYGASRRLDWDHWTDALAHATHWHNHPLLAQAVPALTAADGQPAAQHEPLSSGSAPLGSPAANVSAGRVS